MKSSTRLIGFAALTFAFTSAAIVSAGADETLWNLTFKDLKAGQAPSEVPFTPPCSGPQKVTTDAQDTLAGAKSLGTLQNVVVFDKEGTSHYLPALTLKATSAYTSGVITVSWDVVFDKINPSPTRPVTTLMAFPFMNKDGGVAFIPVIGCNGPTDLFLTGSGFAKGVKGMDFKAGDVAHLKGVLDLNAHTFQLFLGDTPMGPAEHDDDKFSSFLGFTVRDGTALGGNNGETFTAGLSNIVITHS